MTVISDIVLHERANGVVWNNKFYPYKVRAANVTTSILNYKKGVRFYIRELTLSGTMAGVKGGNTNYAQGSYLGDALILNRITLPAMTQATDYAFVSQTVEPHVLLDRETGIIHDLGLDNGNYVIVWAEIDDV